MAELINLIVGIASMIVGSIVIGLFIAVRTLIGKSVPLWIWMFSICVVCTGILSILVVKI